MPASSVTSVNRHRAPGDRPGPPILFRVPDRGGEGLRRPGDARLVGYVREPPPGAGRPVGAGRAVVAQEDPGAVEAREEKIRAPVVVVICGRGGLEEPHVVEAILGRALGERAVAVVAVELAGNPVAVLR